ncbi:hypothetical protein ACQZ55_18765 [Rhizobium sp. 23-156E]
MAPINGGLDDVLREGVQMKIGAGPQLCVRITLEDLFHDQRLLFLRGWAVAGPLGAFRRISIPEPLQRALANRGDGDRRLPSQSSQIGFIELLSVGGVRQPNALSLSLSEVEYPFFVARELLVDVERELAWHFATVT